MQTDNLIAFASALPVHMTGRQIAALATLCSGARTVRGLASEIGVATPVITRMHQHYSSHGLVRRVDDLNDARSCFIEITDKGRELVETLAQKIAA